MPKGFGGQGFAAMLQQAQTAMAQAGEIEEKLATQQFVVDRGPVKGIFNGVGELLKMQIDKSVVDPEDIEALEDLITGVVREGFSVATELRNREVQSVLPNIPGLS